MTLMPKSIGIAPDDEQRFAVRLQPDHTIDNVGARFFERRAHWILVASSNLARSSTLP